MVGFKGEAKYTINDEVKKTNVLTHQFEIPKKLELKKNIHRLKNLYPILKLEKVLMQG